MYFFFSRDSNTTIAAFRLSDDETTYYVKLLENTMRQRSRSNARRQRTLLTYSNSRRGTGEPSEAGDARDRENPPAADDTDDPETFDLYVMVLALVAGMVYVFVVFMMHHFGIKRLPDMRT